MKHRRKLQRVKAWGALTRSGYLYLRAWRTRQQARDWVNHPITYGERVVRVEIRELPSR